MPIQSIDAATVKQWLDNNEIVLVDVREATEHAAEKIEPSFLVPLGSVSKMTLPDYGTKKLVIYCRSGKRSLHACEKLIAEDPTLSVYNLEGGILGWQQTLL